jgi:hypothetical protein
MNALLTAAIVLTALAILVQAGVLVAMYLMSRRVKESVDTFVAGSRQLMTPLESATRNLKTASDDLSEAGKIVREQVRRMDLARQEAEDRLRAELAAWRNRAVVTFDEAKATIMPPLRHWSAVAHGIAVGVRTFFRHPPRDKPEERKYPAA